METLAIYLVAILVSGVFGFVMGQRLRDPIIWREPGLVVLRDGSTWRLKIIHEVPSGSSAMKPPREEWVQVGRLPVERR